MFGYSTSSASCFGCVSRTQYTRWSSWHRPSGATSGLMQFGPRPLQFPKEYPSNPFACSIAKPLFAGNYIVSPLTLTDHFFNFTFLDEFQKFIKNKYGTGTSQDAAIIFLALWMALPYMVPFARANDFYERIFQIPI